MSREEKIFFLLGKKASWTDTNLKHGRARHCQIDWRLPKTSGFVHVSPNAIARVTTLLTSVLSDLAR